VSNAYPLPTYGAVPHPAARNKLRILREVSGSRFFGGNFRDGQRPANNGLSMH
jgi:hypothetical protein